jgi:hypothetical protein
LHGHYVDLIDDGPHDASFVVELPGNLLTVAAPRVGADGHVRHKLDLIPTVRGKKALIQCPVNSYEVAMSFPREQKDHPLGRERLPPGEVLQECALRIAARC